MKRLLAGFAFVAATSVGYADFMGGGGYVKSGLDLPSG